MPKSNSPLCVVLPGVSPPDVPLGVPPAASDVPPGVPPADDDVPSGVLPRQPRGARHKAA
ncbi:MAG: hypothetical protein K5787_21050 [Lentisphaeria bacterium]|nr:hypothetical protein [Lentisphaeria bacterium]